MRIQGNAPWRSLRERAQKIPPLSYGDGEQGVYISLPIWHQQTNSMTFEILEVVCVEPRTDASCLAEQSGNLLLVLC